MQIELEDFQDFTTESLEINNFHGRFNNFLLKKVLKGCFNLFKLTLKLSESEIAGFNDNYEEFDYIPFNTSLNHLVLCN